MSIVFSNNEISWYSSNDQKLRLQFPISAVDKKSSIFHTEDGLGLGAICLIASSNGRLVVCQKSPVEGYEFSNHLVFPGGAVRRNEENVSQPLIEYVSSSLRRRVSKEAGIELTSEELIPATEPVFTQYTAKKIMRYMIVVPFYAKTMERIPIPKSLDHTISRTLLIEPNDELLERLAPANALAFANYMTAQHNREFDSSSIEKRSEEISMRFDLCR